MLRRRKDPWSPALDALPSEERTGALAAQVALAGLRSGLKRARIYPSKDKLAFEALVARVAGLDIPPGDEDHSEGLLDDAHCARDSGTLLAGTGIARGPYGDLFYRVIHGYGAVIDFFYARRYGAYPMDVIPPNVVPGPPMLRIFSTILSVDSRTLLLRHRQILGLRSSHGR